MNYKDEIARARYLISATFGELVFKEDTHQYFLPQLDGSMKEYACVSNYTKQWDQTDFKKIAETYVKNHPDEKDSEGNPITPESVRAGWRKRGEDACEMGTQVHEFAESLGWLSNNEAEKICLSAKPQYNPMTNQLEPLMGYDKLSLKEQAVKKFWDDMATAPQFKDLHFVMAETKVYTSVGPYSEQYNNNYAGTFDLLLYYDDPKGINSGFVIGDYKSNSGTLTKPFVRKNKQVLAYPFEDLFEEPQGHYTLQLSCYQIPLEAIGLRVIGRRLIHLTDKGEYKLIPLPDVTSRIKDSLRGPYISPEELNRED